MISRSIVNSLAEAVDRTLQDHSSSLQSLGVENKNFEPVELETGDFGPFVTNLPPATLWEYNIAEQTTETI